MLAIVSCTCGGAESLARQVLKDGGCNYWIDVPIYQGPETFNCFMDSLPEKVKESEEAEILKFHVGMSGSYVIIVGYTENKLVWADVKNGGIKDRLDAEIIAGNFA